VRRLYLFIVCIFVFVGGIMLIGRHGLFHEDHDTPVTALLKVDQLTEENGGRLLYMTLVFDNNAIPDIKEEPTFEIVNSEGKQIIAGTLALGCGGACSKTWSVPAEMKGTFTARITSLHAPYKMLRLRATTFLL